jgi:hypothetical protein
MDKLCMKEIFNYMQKSRTNLGKDNTRRNKRVALISFVCGIWHCFYQWTIDFK